MHELTDRFGRRLSYLRLAVTDRCNLRCKYCMPAEGLQWSDRSDLLTFEEIQRLVALLASVGVQKVRLTGGEPFLRKSLMDCLERLAAIPDITLAITTNGTHLSPFLPKLEALGIRSINLSLDTCIPDSFARLTRRNAFASVLEALNGLLQPGWNLKINAVLDPSLGEEDWHSLLDLARNHPVEVRFLESMRFNGTANGGSGLTGEQMKSWLTDTLGVMDPLGRSASGTTERFSPGGFLGTVGIIASRSRTFCSSCNRLRVTPKGALRTCLYGSDGLSLRDAMRNGNSDLQLLDAIGAAIQHKAIDGFAAASKQVPESMASIGG